MALNWVTLLVRVIVNRVNCIDCCAVLPLLGVKLNSIHNPQKMYSGTLKEFKSFNIEAPSGMGWEKGLILIGLRPDNCGSKTIEKITWF